MESFIRQMACATLEGNAFYQETAASAAPLDWCLRWGHHVDDRSIVLRLLKIICVHGIHLKYAVG